MFSIKYSDIFYSSLDLFINSYKNTFIKLYSDTWIVDEKIIIDSYVYLWNSLYNTIISKIDHKLKEDLILWRSKNNKGQNCTIIKLTSFVIFLYYSEDTTINSRYIENVEFFKR